MILWLLLACPHPAEPEAAAVPADAFARPPRLPSPESGAYARNPQVPRDPAVASVVGDLQWDASLSGAAAGLALRAVAGDGGLEPWEVREALWRAGYPHAARRIGAWTVPQGAPPPAELAAWLAPVDPTHDLGLVRARGAEGDLWVALHASPSASVGVVPREVPLGGQVSLPRLDGATWSVGAPDGTVIEGRLDGSERVVLDLPGEWLFRIGGADGEIARFPVYADVTPPVEPLVVEVPEPTRADDVVDGARTILDAARDAWGLAALPRYPAFDIAARRLLAGQPVDATLAGAGVAPEDRVTWSCRALTVESCLDRVVWSLAPRAALIAPETTWMGLAGELVDGRVHLAGVFVAESPIADVP